ncbi:MAG: DUF499 domain-containing protein [Deltaproteobacteria bacterium]
MKTIFESCTPRPEVLKGELKDEIFRASLIDVHLGKADPVYRDPIAFFENTYRTEGLKTLLNETLGRLTGRKPANSPIIRLETSFGGGKTHNLIALYHVAKGAAAPVSVADLLPPDFLPQSPIRVVPLVGSDLDPASGLRHGNVTTYTLWGEMAWLLGGQAGYRMIETNDRDRMRPGETTIKDLLGDEPALILIDELATYLRAAKGLTVGGTNLAEMTTAFFMSLLGAVGSLEKVVIVYTLADSQDAFSEETEEIHKVLREASALSARQERVITPTTETEIAPIVTRRMFQSIDKNAAAETAQSYHDFYQRLTSQGIDLPVRAIQADYTLEIASSYPFHPELLTTLNRKTATIPNFQKTRGALRLLGMTIRTLWEQQPAGTSLIHPWHLDLGAEDILNDLTSRLERPKFRHVVEADILSPLSGSKAHAQEIDDPWLQAGKRTYAGRAAGAIFLHSIVQGVASGVDPSDLTLAVLQPGDDPTLLQKALDRLYDTCWFLEYDGNRYRFKTEPSLNKIIEDEMQLVGQTKAKTELDSRIRSVWKKGPLEPVYFPAEAAEVDDDTKEPKLVVIHYDAAATGQDKVQPPEIILKIYERTGIAEGYRTYRNNLLFLVSDKDQISPMVEKMRRYLAIRRIIKDDERFREFTKTDREKLQREMDETELLVRVAITKAYHFLYYPSPDAPKRSGFLAREALPAQDQGDVQKDQSAVILKRLKDLNRVLTADDPPLSATFLKAKAWPGEQKTLTTEALRKTFSQKLSLRMLLDVNQLKKTIKNGIEQGTWVYYDAGSLRAYGKGAPVPLVQISEDTQIYLPDEAARLGLWPPKEKCPICGKEKSACICESESCPVCDKIVNDCICAGEPKPACIFCGHFPCVCKNMMKAEGPPAQAFQSIFDQSRDHKVSTLKALTITLDGMGQEIIKDVAAMGLAVPQMGNVDCTIRFHLKADWDQDEHFSVTFNGTWDRYKRLKDRTDAFAKEASKASARMVLAFSFMDGLSIEGERFAMMKDILTTLGIGKIQVQAEPL